MEEKWSLHTSSSAYASCEYVSLKRMSVELGWRRKTKWIEIVQRKTHDTSTPAWTKAWDIFFASLIKVVFSYDTQVVCYLWASKIINSCTFAHSAYTRDENVDSSDWWFWAFNFIDFFLTSSFRSLRQSTPQSIHIPPHRNHFYFAGYSFKYAAVFFLFLIAHSLETQTCFSLSKAVLHMMLFSASIWYRSVYG